MKKFIIGCISVLCVFVVNAQNSRNYIYLLDCTKSMVGYGGSPNIWENTKDYLSKDLERLDKNCSYYIIPFNDKILNIYSGSDGTKAHEAWADEIERKCDDWVELMTYTNICDSWEKGLAMCSKDKYNYVYLLTDGVDNMPNGGVQKLARLMKAFCGKSKYTHIYYVMLTKNAINKDIIQIAELCENIHIVDASDGPVNPFCILDQTTINLNAKEVDKMKKIGFGLAGEYKASIKCNDPYFDVRIKNSCIKNNCIEFVFSKKQELDDEDYDFDIMLNIDGVEILNNPITVKVVNRHEKNIDLHGIGDLGEAVYVEPFLFFEGKLLDTLSIDLSAKYNEYAKTHKSIVKFEIVPGEKMSNLDFQVIFNGKKCNDKIITITPDENLLQLIFDPNTKDGSHIFYLKCIKHSKLDKINDNAISKYKKTDADNDLQLKAEFNKDWHWLKTLLFWTAIIVAILIGVWFIVFRPIFIKKIKTGYVVILDPYFKNCKIHKCRKVVFTSNVKAHDNILKRIFIGKTLYEINQTWSDNLIIESAHNGGCRLNTGGNYTISPYTSQLRTGEEYELISNKTNEKIKILIN